LRPQGTAIASHCQALQLTQVLRAFNEHDQRRADRACGHRVVGGFCQCIGLTDLLCAALASTRQPAPLHAPGRVLARLAVMVAHGGRWVSDRVVLAGQGALFGAVASGLSARRVLLSVGRGELDAIGQARAIARERAWRAGRGDLRLRRVLGRRS
jgi:hypothetical protein